MKRIDKKVALAASIVFLLGIGFLKKTYDLYVANNSKYPTLMNTTSNAITSKVLSIAKKFQSLQDKFKESPFTGDTSFFGSIHAPIGNFGTYMPGVALIGAKLAIGKENGNFFVCQTMEGFKEKLKFVFEGALKKAAFIIPVNMSYQNDNFAQHKIPILIQKMEDGTIHIAIFESQVEKKDFAILILKKNFSFIQRACQEANIENKKFEFYHLNFSREVSYGCAIFALRDCMEFLRADHDFFAKIKDKKEPNEYYHTFKETSLKCIEASDLDPIFLAGWQSISKLEKYMDVVVSRKNRSLKNYITKYQVNNFEKIQNHFITYKMLKYYEMLLKELETKNLEEIKQQLEGILVA